MKYLIDFKNNLLKEEIEQYISSLNGTIIKTFSFYDKTYLVDLPNQPVYNEAIHEIIIDDNSNPIQLLSTTIMSDQTWGTTTLTGPTVTISTSDTKDWWKNCVILTPNFDTPSYKIDRRGLGYTVYILDSGCEINHQEFVNRPITNLFSFNDNFIDTNGHGTAIASIITGNDCGVTDATVKVVKIFDKNQPTKQSDLVNALDAIYQDFIQNKMSFAVINCSWAIEKNTFIESKLQSLINLGMIIVASAGNNGSSIMNVTPAGMNDVITIGSFNENLVPSDFSNYTDSLISITNNQNNYGELDGWAPGEKIYSAGLNNSYGYVAGTSIAAGIHSAIIAYNLTVSDIVLKGNLSLLDFIKNNSLGRANLLDLSDSKYQSSVNKISTLINHFSNTSNIKFSSFAKAVVGQQFYLKVFDPRQTKTLEILGELPPETTIYPNGFFIGKTQFVNEVKKEIVPMRLTDKNDQVFLFDLNIITVPTDFVPGQDTTNDPILDLQLSVVDCWPSSPCEPPLAPGQEAGCNDNCPAPFACNTAFDKSCPSTVRCECS